jgi:hypothetical protein
MKRTLVVALAATSGVAMGIALSIAVFYLSEASSSRNPPLSDCMNRVR